MNISELAPNWTPVAWVWRSGWHSGWEREDGMWKMAARDPSQAYPECDRCIQVDLYRKSDGVPVREMSNVSIGEAISHIAEAQ